MLLDKALVIVLCFLFGYKYRVSTACLKMTGHNFSDKKIYVKLLKAFYTFRNDSAFLKVFSCIYEEESSL